jgi:hypothetical protein
MTQTTSMAEVTQKTIEDRVARLRTDLYSTPQGCKILVELTPLGTIHVTENIVDFCDWGQSWTQWSQG